MFHNSFIFSLSVLRSNQHQEIFSQTSSDTVLFQNYTSLDNNVFMQLLFEALRMLISAQITSRLYPSHHILHIQFNIGNSRQYK